MINRQAGSGTRHYIDQQFSKLGIDAKKIEGYDVAVATHLEIGLKILRAEADAGIASGAAARLLGLDFIPLTRERFDIVIPEDTRVMETASNQGLDIAMVRRGTKLEKAIAQLVDVMTAEAMAMQPVSKTR